MPALLSGDTLKLMKGPGFNQLLRFTVKTATNQNGESQNSDMPETAKKGMVITATK